MSRRFWITSYVAGAMTLVACHAPRASDMQPDSSQQPDGKVDEGRHDAQPSNSAGDASSDAEVVPGDASDAEVVLETLKGHWEPMNAEHSEGALSYGSAVWNGSHVFYWGGIWEEPNLPQTFKVVEHNSGGLFNPSLNKWTPIAAPLIQARGGHGATWNGSEFLIFGGAGVDGEPGAITQLGARYNPATGVWQTMTPVGQPEPRMVPLLAWTNQRLLVWGGQSDRKIHGTAALYDPASDQWRKLDTSAFLLPEGATSMWSGSEVFFWGGYDESAQLVAGGGRYDPSTEAFHPLPTTGAPSVRSSPLIVRLGHEFMVWGGTVKTQTQPPARKWTSTGAIYNAAADAWRPVSSRGAPSGGIACRAWTGTYLLLWDGPLAEGLAYDPVQDRWWKLPQEGAPSPRRAGCIWAGDRMIVWSRADEHTRPESGAMLLLDGE